MKRKTDATESPRPTKKVKFADENVGGFLDSDDDKEESAVSSDNIEADEFGIDAFEGDEFDADEFDLNDINQLDDESDSKKREPISSPNTNDSDESNDDFLELGSDGDSDDDDMYKLEAMASLQQQREERVRMDEEAEREEQYRMNQEEQAKDNKFVFPKMKDLIAEKENPPNLEVLKYRIESILEILSSFKTLHDGIHVRKEYVSVLGHSMARYYGYSEELIKMFLTMFNPNECLAFLEANEQSRPLTIRCNTMKCRRRDLAKMLIDRGVNLDPLADWTKEGLKIAKTGNNLPLGATPEYLAGYYMIQSAASLLPVMALGIKGMVYDLEWISDIVSGDDMMTHFGFQSESNRAQ